MSMISAKQMRAMAHELRRDTGTEYSDVDLRMYDASEMLRTLATEREQASQAVGVVAKLRELYEAIPVGPCSHVALAVKGILDAEPAEPVKAVQGVPGVFIRLLDISRRVPSWTGTKLPDGCCSDVDFNQAIQDVDDWIAAAEPVVEIFNGTNKALGSLSIRAKKYHTNVDDCDICDAIDAAYNRGCEDGEKSMTRCCQHDSDCAIHNAPALPVGPCNCSVQSANGGEVDRG